MRGKAGNMQQFFLDVFRMMLQYTDFTHNRVQNEAPAGVAGCPAGRSHRQLNSHPRKEENQASHFKYYV